MAQSISGYLVSETFEVIAQSGERRFLVHSGILAAQSERLRNVTRDALAQGNPTDRTIDLREWDGDTVGRFVEFLYLGRYQVPNPKRPAPKPDSVMSDDDMYQQDTNMPAAQSVVSEPARSDRAETVRPRMPVGPRPLTPLLQYGLGLQDDSNEVLWPGLFDPAICEYRDVLLAHSRVYSLARKQEVDGLWRLAYQHLLSTLQNIGSVEPGWLVTADFVDLLRYVYSDMVPAEEGEEPLQNLVSQFAALNFPALQCRGEMTGLIREGGKLASDLMDKVCKRLLNSEAILREVVDSRATPQGAGRHECCSQNEDVKRDLRFQQQKASALESKVRNLRGRVGESGDKLVKAETELQAQQQKVSALESTIQTLEGSVKESGDKLEKAQTELMTCRMKSHTLREGARASEVKNKSRLSEAETQLGAQRREICALEARIRTLESGRGGEGSWPTDSKSRRNVGRELIKRGGYKG